MQDEMRQPKILSLEKNSHPQSGNKSFKPNLCVMFYRRSILVKMGSYYFLEQTYIFHITRDVALKIQLS